MQRVKMHAAKTYFSKLIAQVERGEEVIVQRGDKPVAKIVPYRDEPTPRKRGALKGQIRMAPDFDEIPPEFDEYIR
ncbi:MAG: hypothetical protein QOJ22_497 [Thermoleophilaceae bacterium]|jgi:prevent-host-death family protein|nr:hypothetical protein [Thermoleophilaceae bacterium]